MAAVAQGAPERCVGTASKFERRSDAPGVSVCAASVHWNRLHDPHLRGRDHRTRVMLLRTGLVRGSGSEIEHWSRRRDRQPNKATRNEDVRSDLK